MTLSLNIVKLDPHAHIPSSAHAGDAGLDLHSLNSHTIKPFQRLLIPTGLALQIPFGYAGFVLPRSGLSSRQGLTLINSPGLIDSGYRGELQIAVVNLDPENEVNINAGDRIAQLVIMQVPFVHINEIETLDETTRGTQGFGSSGVEASSLKG